MHGLRPSEIHHVSTTPRREGIIGKDGTVGIHRTDERAGTDLQENQIENHGKYHVHHSDCVGMERTNA